VDLDKRLSSPDGAVQAEGMLVPSAMSGPSIRVKTLRSFPSSAAAAGHVGLPGLSPPPARPGGAPSLPWGGRAGGGGGGPLPGVPRPLSGGRLLLLLDYFFFFFFFFFREDEAESLILAQDERWRRA
jgi:hypothetical protein